MNDRELLELSAKAMGYEIEWANAWSYCYVITDQGESYWNPLDEDDDAFRLAVNLGMDIFQFTNHVQVYEPGGGDYKEDYNGDCCAATRRAIVRAAAAITKGKS